MPLLIYTNDKLIFHYYHGIFHFLLVFEFTVFLSYLLHEYQRVFCESIIFIVFLELFLS